MQTDSVNSGSITSKDQPALLWALLVLFLAVIAWCARYWMSGSFGLYEDDLTFLPMAMEADFNTILSTISGYFSTLAEQGRPLMWSWVVFLGHLGWRLGGLQGMYVLAYLMWLLNITLFVTLLRRIYPNLLFGVAAGMAYVVFAADTTQSFLFNAYGLQTAITLLLIALHLYISGSKIRWLSYIFLTLVLFNYETPFLLFLAAPLLTKQRGKVLLKYLVLNALIVGAIFLGVYFLRLTVGESRVASLGFTEMIQIGFRHMAIGPFVALGSYGLRPLQVARHLSLEVIIWMFLGVLAFFGMLYWAFRQHNRPRSNLLTIKQGWWSSLTGETQRELRLLAAGLLMLIMAYPLTVILRPQSISGRATRVHLAAVVGAALIIGCLVTLLLHGLRKKGWQIGFIVLVSLGLATNFAYGWRIQGDYSQAWTLQKDFWADLLPLIQDAGENTAILVDPSGLADVPSINANTWNLPRMLRLLFVIPEDWESPPQVFRLVDGWEENIIRVERYFTLDGTNTFANMVRFGDFLQRETIFITTDGGELNRLLSIPIQGQTITLKPVGKPVLPALDTRLLYDLMIPLN